LDDIAAQFGAAPLSGTVIPGFRGARQRTRIRATHWLNPGHALLQQCKRGDNLLVEAHAYAGMSRATSVNLPELIS
jgi:hypothetical protein